MRCRLFLFVAALISISLVSTAECGAGLPALPKLEVTSNPAKLGKPVYRMLPDNLRREAEALLGQPEALPPGERVSESAETGTEIYIGLAASLKGEASLEPDLALQQHGHEAFSITYKAGRPSTLIICANSPYGLSCALQRLADYIAVSARGRFISLSYLLDYPSFPVRGVIEGFYGTPWSNSERAGMLRFMGRVKLNYYFQAPKADPSHRDEWRRPHSREELDNYKYLHEEAKRQGVSFVYCISPGKSIEYGSQADYQTLLSKMLTINRLGISDMGLLMDDISSDLRSSADRSLFKSLGEAQVALVLRLKSDLQKAAPSVRLFFCPTKYFGTEPEKSQYLNLLAKLPDGVEIFWTGSRVYAPSITIADARRIGNVLRRQALYWDNFPVNDYIASRLHLGPLLQREAGLEDAARGLVMNAMNQSEASKIALYTAASYLWNSQAYTPQQAWRQALKDVGGEEALPFLTYLAARLSGSAHWQEHISRDLSARIERLQADYASGNAQQALFELDIWLSDLEQNCRQLRTTLDNPALLAELSPLLNKLESISGLCRREISRYAPGKRKEMSAAEAEALNTAINQALSESTLTSQDIKTMVTFLHATADIFCGKGMGDSHLSGKPVAQ